MSEILLFITQHGSCDVHMIEHFAESSSHLHGTCIVIIFICARDGSSKFVASNGGLMSKLVVSASQVTVFPWQVIKLLC